MKTIVFVPCDASEKNQCFVKQFITSFKKFHPDVEIRVFDNPNPQDKDFWYRAKPLIACQLFDEGYELVIGADADQIVLGSLSDILEDTEDFDVGVVLNDPMYPIQVWDIQPIVNCGLVVLKSKEFAEHWRRLCFTEHFPNYQFREQDLLNILKSDYFNYKVKYLETKKIYGECGKPFWIQATMEEGKVIIPTQFGPKQLCMYHSGGGNTPDKGNYKIRFQPEVVKYIDSLIK
jgi:hypothetical protein